MPKIFTKMVQVSYYADDDLEIVLSELVDILDELEGTSYGIEITFYSHGIGEYLEAKGVVNRTIRGSYYKKTDPKTGLSPAFDAFKASVDDMYNTEIINL